MRQLLATLHIPGSDDDHYRIIEVPDYGENQFYVQSVSIDAFSRREVKKAFPELPPGVNWMEYARTIKYCTIDWNIGSASMYGVNLNSLPVSKGVWQFYLDIGYDRVKKRYKE